MYIYVYICVYIYLYYIYTYIVWELEEHGDGGVRGGLAELRQEE